jgi:hypothetical protein
MARELRVFVGEPLAVRPRAQLGARPLTRHGSQLWGHRVDTRSYVLPSLRDSKLCNFKKADVRLKHRLLPSSFCFPTRFQPHLEQICRIGYPPVLACILGDLELRPFKSPLDRWQTRP